MGEFIKRFSDGSFIEYDEGNFDKWCVYYNFSTGGRTPPKDTDYFEQLRVFARRYGAQRIYDDFVRVYDMTGKQLDPNVLERITDLSLSYGRDALAVDVIFSILYVAMISEEKVVYTRLGKRIKRLGVHLLLLENESVSYAANIMRGKKWYEIDADCKERGF